MTDFEINIMNNITVDAVAKSIVNEASKFGFKQADYIKLVNALVDLSLAKKPLVESNIATQNEPSVKIQDLPISNNNLSIRRFNRVSDYDIVNKWLEDSFGGWFLLSRSYTRDRTLDELIEDDRNVIGVIELSDSQPIGLMGYLDVDNNHHRAEMRKLIGEQEHRGKGFAKQATKLWINYGISALGLKKIYLNTIENNIRNVTINKELGFQIEGVLRKECFFEGKYYDLLRMGLIVE